MALQGVARREQEPVMNLDYGIYETAALITLTAALIFRGDNFVHWLKDVFQPLSIDAI